MSVYKYLNEARKDVLENLQIRFTPPHEFNDPFEMNPYFESVFTENQIKTYFSESVNESNKELFFSNIPEENRDLYTKEEWLEYGKACIPLLIDSEIPIISNIKNVFTDAARTIMPLMLQNTLGVLCCSFNLYDLKMWGHYANSHKGFVVSFNQNHSFFKNKHTDTNEKEYSIVKYTYERPKIKDMTTFDITPTLFIKSKEWEHEQEYRAIKLLIEADNQDGNIHLFNIPPECIEGVYIGALATNEFINQIVSIFSNNQYLNGKFIKQMQLSQEHFDFAAPKLISY